MAFVSTAATPFSRLLHRPATSLNRIRPIMTLSKGDKMPMDVELMILSDGGPTPISTSAVFANKKVALVTIPGALTTTCQNSHIPQWIRAVDDFKSKGVDEIVCLAVNDPFVMDVFEKAVSGSGKLKFVSDGGAILTKKLGIDIDTAGFGGVRSKRGGFLVDNGVFTQVNIEEDGTGYKGPSKPETLLSQL